MIWVAFDDEGKQQTLTEDLRFVSLFTDYKWVQTDKELPLGKEFLLGPRGGLSFVDEAIYEEKPYFKIYDYVKGVHDIYDAPFSIIFPEQLTTSLYKTVTMVFGERVRTVYFTDKEKNNPLIKVEDTTERDSNSSVTSKVRKISWILSNGEWSTETKELDMTSTSSYERTEESISFRSNVITGLTDLANQMGLGKKVQELITHFSDEVDIYIRSGSPKLFESIRDNQDIPELDTVLPNGMVLRQALLLHLQVGVSL